MSRLCLILFFCTQWGCFPFDPRTKIDELRVVAVQSEPAEITPNEEVAIKILIADPKGEGADVLVWPCTDLGDGCLEKDLFADDTSAWIQSFSYTDPVTTLSFVVPPSLGPVIQQLPEDFIPFNGTVLWVLACVPGQCDAISDFEQGTLGVDNFSNPKQMIEDVEFGVASLAKRSLLISERLEEERIQNPILLPEFTEELKILQNESMELNFSYSLTSPEAENVFLSGYATAGYIVEEGPRGFNQEEALSDGSQTLVWQAEEEVATGSLYVVLEDGFGGLDFLVHPIQVE
jgi:hypothetical protein